jgi:hypothetical protein
MRGRWYFEYHRANANMSVENFTSVHMGVQGGEQRIKGLLKKALYDAMLESWRVASKPLFGSFA